MSDICLHVVQGHDCSIAATHLSIEAFCCIAVCNAWYSFLYFVSMVAAL